MTGEPGLKEDKTATVMTTIKLAPALGAAIRLLAAINGVSAGELVEESIRDVVRKNGKTAPKVKRKSSAGRRPQTVTEAALAVARLRAGKNDSIPTRIHERTHRAFDTIASQQGRYMNDLIAETASERILASGVRICWQVAGFEGDAEHFRGLEQVREVAGGGDVPEQGWSGRAP